MATGIPKKSGNGQSAVPMELEYSGKADHVSVLHHPPAQLVSVWRHPSASGKCLYFGDNLDVLAALAQDKSVCGKIKLIYIDPPFATEGVFVSRKQEHAYHDDMVGAEYVESLRRRLILLHHLLSEEGSIYLHIDEKMVFHLKLVLDEVFGAGNYRNCITRKKCNPKNYTRKTFGNVADYILFYSKSDNYVWNRQYEPWTEDRAKEYQYIDEKTGRRFMKVPIHAPGIRNGDSGKPWRGIFPPPGKHWQYAPSTLEEMDARGEIFWSSSGNPRRKVFLDDRPGVGVQDIWLDFRDAHNQNIQITGYPTEKNPDLLRRIIRASSNPGDLVLDCYCGSGTTLAIADELKRKWIGIDSSPLAIKTVLNRFVHGIEIMGDFVSGAKGKADNELQMGLFDSLATNEDVDFGGRQIAITTEIEIFSSAVKLDAISDIVHEWNLAAVKVDPSAVQKASIVAESATGVEAEMFLAKADSVLASLIKKYGSYPLRARVPQFGFIVEAIVGQQLSPKAADSILKRLKSVCGGRLTAKRILAFPIDSLKSAGLSQRKAEAIRSYARAVDEGLIRLSAFSQKSDDEVREELMAVKGIGPWTAEMFLIFAMARPDVFSLHDGALKSVIGELYKVDTDQQDKLVKLSDRWRPYRSVACWYLYRYKNDKEKVF